MLLDFARKTQVAHFTGQIELKHDFLFAIFFQNLLFENNFSFKIGLFENNFSFKIMLLKLYFSSSLTHRKVFIWKSDAS